MVHEFTRDQLALALGESRAAADWLLTVAWHLATRLGVTLDALRDGIITRAKAELIVRLTQYLSDDEARQVEAEIAGRAGRLTPGGLRSALARAVMEAAPGKARQRRETAAKFARVERWAEDSGNAALMGRELPPDEVLAADQQISWWAGELKQAGLEGGMDELRARAFLDLVLGKDSRPRAAEATGTAGHDGAPGAGPAPDAGPARGAAGGFAGRVTLTVPLGTAAGLRGPARRARRAGPGRPVAGPRPRRRRGGQPQVHVVRDGHRSARPRRRPRLRPARTRKPPQTRRTRPAAGRDRVLASPRPAGTARPADTAPGGCASPAAGRT